MKGYLKNIVYFLDKVANPTSRFISHVGAGILACMMFLTAMDVLLRYFFNRPISGAFELTEFMMVVTVVSGLGYCTMEKSHVRVEVLIERFSPKIQTILYSLTSLLSLLLFILITKQGIVYAMILLKDKLTSPVLFIPTFPFAIILAVGTGVFCLAIFSEFVYFLSKAVKE